MLDSPWPARLDDVPDLPSFPEPAARALALPASDDAPIDVLLHALRTDEPLAAQIRRVAGQGDDLRASVVRLGFIHVRNLLVGAAVLRSFDSFFAGAPYSREDFWRHSIGVGLVAARLSRSAGNLPVSIAFLAGLLHDVGKLVLDRHCRAAWNAALRMSRDARLPLHEAERRMIGGDHARIGAALLEAWKVPEEVVAPVRAHHAPASCPEPHRRLAMLLEVADFLCVARRVGYGGNEWPDLPSPLHLDALRLTEDIRESAMEGLDSDPLLSALLSI